MLTFIFCSVMHLETAITVKEDNQTQMDGEKETDRHCYTKVYNYAIIQNVEISAKEVQYRPVSEKFVN